MHVRNVHSLEDSNESHEPLRGKGVHTPPLNVRSQPALCRRRCPKECGIKRWWTSDKRCAVLARLTRPSSMSVSHVNSPAQDRSLYRRMRSLWNRSWMIGVAVRGPSTIPLMTNSMRYVGADRLRKKREICKWPGG